MRGIGIACLLVGVPAGLAVADQLGIRLNLTPSEPIGIWRIARLDRPVAVGNLVFVCPPQRSDMRRARERGYLRSGRCPGGFAPLIKSVAAIAGQRIEIGAAVGIDGVLLSHSRLLAVDGRGRPLTSYGGGVVAAGEVFLHSPVRASFDSRYFGPVPACGILGLAREVATYAP